MSAHTPWTKEQSEKWAMESDVVRYATFEDDAIAGFLAGMAKAAEMIEASPTVYGISFNDGSSEWETRPGIMHYNQAKLVGVRPIEEEK